jgi:hypothetical protein
VVGAARFELATPRVGHVQAWRATLRWRGHTMDDLQGPDHNPPAGNGRTRRYEPEAHLRQVIARTGAHPVNRLHDLLPRNIASWATPSVAA